ncbi:MAG: UDP-4-amino-4,6-dideoxy-N-acetyl-beta-L-altrosamine transaminase [Nitrospiria bacterium]
MLEFIPYGRQSISDEDIAEVVRVLRSEWLTQGPGIEKFEQLVAHYCGAKEAIAVSNGTAALHAACFAAGISPGDEVITSPITFVASANAILYCGGRPIFADIDESTGNIDPNEIEKKISKRTKAIIPVHYAGQPCDLDEIHHIARKHGLIVIEDSAHALGAIYKGKRVGSLSEMTTFSFHPVKHITTGEGGMILTNNEAYYQKLLLFRNHGITRESGLMEKSEGPWYYEMQELGYNYRITDIQCALGISQIKKLDIFIQERKRIAAEYREYFNKELCDFVFPLFEKGDRSHAYHLFPVKIDFKKIGIPRARVMKDLRSQGIGSQVHYIPVHLQPFYKRTQGWNRGDFPKAERFYDQILSLPMYPSMPKEGVRRVTEGIDSILKGKK